MITAFMLNFRLCNSLHIGAGRCWQLGGHLTWIVCAVRTKIFRQRPIFVKPHPPSTTRYAVMLVYKIFSVVAVKNQMVSHAEHTLKLLIHQISQHDSA